MRNLLVADTAIAGRRQPQVANTWPSRLSGSNRNRWSVYAHCPSSPLAAWQKPWVAQVQGAGRGRTALRYLAAYVKKSAFSECTRLGYDQAGRIVMSYRDSADGKLKNEALDSRELIARWLLLVLPKSLARIRHYGWLSPAAHKAFVRVRFLLGLGPYRIPALPKSEPPCCPFCNGPLSQIARIAPQRGPPLWQAILKAAA